LERIRRLSMDGNAWLFRGTNMVRGRRRIIDDTNSGLQFLRYGRIVLESESLEVATHGEEIAFVCLNGHGEIEVQGESYELGKYDALYVPRDAECSFKSSERWDLAEVACPASRAYPVQLVRFKEILRDPEMAKQAGRESYSRRLHTIVGQKNVRAARVLAGVTFSKQGNWTSWPPHEHDGEKEEIYLYVDMPHPNFGLHLNYTDLRDPELITPVWEGDAVAIKKGYHYNVATPGTEVGFVWMMAAIREEVDRDFSVARVEPEFAGDRFKLF
jgi:5-deoxy-glucuronate isomerase